MIGVCWIGICDNLNKNKQKKNNKKNNKMDIIYKIKYIICA